MITAIIKGTLAGIKINTPVKGQDFAPNQTLGIIQVTAEGDVETVKIKDENLANKYDGMVGKTCSLKCALVPWQNGSRSGLSIKLIESLPSGKA